jgi:hypothetical protein
MRAPSAHIQHMPSKPIELPPAVARRFVEDMRAFFEEASPIKRDEIAGRQMSVLRQYQGPREKPVRIPDAVTKRAKKAGGDWEVEEF